MQLLEQLELVDVNYEDQRATLLFIDESTGELREIKWNKKRYDNATNTYVEDSETAEKMELRAREIFNLSFEQLAEAIGDKKDVYAYDTFNSLQPVNIVNKFDKDFVGQIMEVEVTEVTDNGRQIAILFDYEGQRYGSFMKYADFVEAKNQYFVNPIKKTKQYAKFKEKFHIDIEDKEQLVGQNVMIEIKLAFKTHVYVEVKPLLKPKK